MTITEETRAGKQSLIISIFLKIRSFLFFFFTNKTSRGTGILKRKISERTLREMWKIKETAQTLRNQSLSRKLLTQESNVIGNCQVGAEVIAIFALLKFALWYWKAFYINVVMLHVILMCFSHFMFFANDLSLAVYFIFILDYENNIRQKVNSSGFLI